MEHGTYATLANLPVTTVQQSHLNPRWALGSNLLQPKKIEYY